MNPIQFTTSDLNELDVHLINILLTQARHDRKAVKRAVKFVIAKLDEEEA